MKKLIFIFTAIVLISIGFFTSCEEKPLSEEPKIVTTSSECMKFNINENEYVQMCISPYIVSANNPTPMLIIKNNTTKSLGYGRAFYLEYFNGEDWESLPSISSSIQLAITMEGLCTRVGEASEYEMKFQSSIGSVSLYSLIENWNSGKKGLYRMIKSEMFFYHKELPMIDGDLFELYAEFKID
jgi:hypothetical protein